MGLSLEQIKKQAQDRPKKREIARSILHENRLKFHTETELLLSELSPYYNDFINWICAEQPEILPKDKVARFKQLLTCPVSTIQLTESISHAWSRIFEGEDAFCRYEFDNPNDEADWAIYRDDEFWQTDGFKAMLNAIDSIWVVDLPQVQEGDRPEPKNLLIDIRNVIDISTNKNGECNYVIFAMNDKLFVYDDTSIRSFNYDGKQIKGLISEYIHGLGYCPARTFWTTLLNGKNYINHKAPLTNVLSELDWLLVHKTFKKYMDIANSYPILVTYEMGDDSTDLTREDNKGRTEGEQKTLGKAIPGPGTILQIPVPMEGQPDLMANPVKWIAPEVNSLQFHVDEDVRLTDYIFKTAVGIDGEQSNDQAKNEKQVAASFENQTIILKQIARNFELIETFADEVIINIRYGKPVNVSIDLGSKFFLKTTTDLVSEAELLKDDDVLSDASKTELLDTKYRNDPAGRIRAKAIRDLDPLPGKSIDETISIKNAGGIEELDFKIKINLMALVLRFEREQMPLGGFFKTGSYSEKIKKIRSEFEKYLNANPAEEEAGKVEQTEQENEREQEDQGELES